MDINSARIIIGVDADASIVDIKKAYRRLAAHHHPDRHGQSPTQTQKAVENMQLLNTAYSLLETTCNKKNNKRHHPELYPQPPTADKNWTKTKPNKRPVKLLFTLTLIVVFTAVVLFFGTREPAQQKTTTETIKTVDNFKKSPPLILFTVDDFNEISKKKRIDIQQKLNKVGYDDIGVIDGVFGPKTMAVVHHFCNDFSIFTTINNPNAFLVYLDIFSESAQSFHDLQAIVTSASFQSWFASQQHNLPNPFSVTGHNIISLVDKYIFTQKNPLPKQLPLSGILWQDNTSHFNQPLRLINNKNRNYYFKIVDTYSQKELLYGFIRPLETIDLRAKHTSCEIHIAMGKTWYGKEYLFGPETFFLKTTIPSQKEKNTITLDITKLPKTQPIRKVSILHF